MVTEARGQRGAKGSICSKERLRRRQSFVMDRWRRRGLHRMLRESGW